MTLEYPAKADSDIRCIAKLDGDDWKPGDLRVAVEALREDGTVVVRGEIRLWVSDKPQ